jgi:ribosomal protein S8
MFSFGSTGHCLVVSPMFWTLILLFIIVVLLIGMASLNGCVQESKRNHLRSTIKSVFLRTDLVVSIKMKMYSSFTCIIIACAMF